MQWPGRSSGGGYLPTPLTQKRLWRTTQWAGEAIGNEARGLEMGLMKVIGDDPSDKLLRSVREVQFLVEGSIEDMRQLRAQLDNAVFDLTEHLKRERAKVPIVGLSPVRPQGRAS